MSIRAGLVPILALVLVGSVWLGVTTGSRAAHAAVSQNLDAGFDADGNVYLTFADGTRIGTPNPPGTVIPAGTYTIALNNNSLDDLGNAHSFHLFGPGVNLSAGTTIVQATWTATFLPASSYTYQDDLNPTTIHDVFGTPGSGATSTTVPAPTTTTPTQTGPSTTTKAPTDNSPLESPSLAFRGTLTGSVAATGALTLKRNGKTVSSLLAGRYTFTVTDGSKKGGFTVQQIKKAATTVTGAAFTGKKSVTIDLEAGQWFFYSSFVGKKTYFIVMT